ncbi:nucleotide sugar dehydrogenase [bacterium]|nr:nucleotide sugar dehydrogenase [bacterium]
MNLKEKIVKRKARIGILGLGYVGLPLACEFARAGFKVTGIDIDRERIKRIKTGRHYIEDVGRKEVVQLIKRRSLKPTSDFNALRGLDVVIICVPTPLRKTKDPDISYVTSATKKIAQYSKNGQLIILESTTYPGTTREVIFPILKETRKKFHLAFSPERVDPGNKEYTLKNTPKIVSGITEECTRLAKALYEEIVNEVIVVSSTEIAEMVKLLENTFRSVNIGLVNEMALMCHRLGIDVWEVIEAAKTKPFGFMPFYPGPGLGGHCLPIDPHYLSWKLKTLDFYARFIELAGEINSKMPEFLVERIEDALNKKRKALKGSKVLILGVAYKKDVSDTRESPAMDVIKILQKKGTKVSYYDPHVPKIKIDRKIMKSQKTPLLEKQDCVVIVTAHTIFNYSGIVKRARLIIDSRNATKGIKNRKIVKL